MAKSIRTAENIFQEITDLKREIKELGAALDEIEEYTLPAKILKEEYQRKERILLTFLKTEWTREVE